MGSPETRKSGYLPGLDGLRAIAILGVLATHDLPWSVAGHSNEKWKGYGGWGVDLFFAISGVLICWRLLEDESKLGKIHLGAFYIRRLFRIQPAAFAYLAVVAALFAFAAVPSSWTIWRSAALSYANFVVTPATPAVADGFLGHFWTLAVEEHFYILISALFFLARARRASLLGTLFVALLLAQIYAEKHGLYSAVVSARRTYWVIQFLLFPALLTLLVRRAAVRRFFLAYGKPWAATLAVIAAMWIHLLWITTKFFTTVVKHLSLLNFIAYNETIFFYGFGLWVIAIMFHPDSLSTRFLELRPVRLFGRLSYSIYLWHILFFVPVYIPNLIHSRLLLILAQRPWKYVATTAVVLISYYVIEKPMIRLGHRLAPPATAGHLDLNTGRTEMDRDLVPAESPA